MISFPQAKINLGLYITGKRSDGFHALESVFYRVPFEDALEVIQADRPSGDLRFFPSGLPIPGDVESNLVVRIYRKLHERFGLPAVDVYLHKAIPMGGGLGGGSSDGAEMLKLLVRMFQLPLSKTEQLEYAAELGSDCPFFIYDSACLVTGRGEILEEFDFSLRGWQLVLINPGIHVSTGHAFSLISLKPAPTTWFDQLQHTSVDSWNEFLYNDFEAPVVKAFPEIGEVIHLLKCHGASYVSMSGSGSTVYALFKELPVLSGIPKQWSLHQTQL